jgi:hypothetical protein
MYKQTAAAIVQLVAAWNQRSGASSTSKDKSTATATATAAASYFTDSSYVDALEFTVPSAWYKAVPRSGVWTFTLQYAGKARCNESVNIAKVVSWAANSNHC